MVVLSGGWCGGVMMKGVGNGVLGSRWCAVFIYFLFEPAKIY